MLIKAGNVMGLKVYTVSEGKEIGQIDDVIYDAHSNQVMALLLAGGGLFADSKVIFLKDTKAIGKDAVLIDSEKSLQEVSKIPEHIAHIAEGHRHLTRTKVITEEGTNLGIISDILFNPETGKVEEFEVSQGLRDISSGKKTINVPDIVTVGEDAMIVKSYTEKKFETQSRERGLKGAVTQVSARVGERAPEVMEDTRSKTQDLAGNLRKKYQEFMGNPKTQQAASEARQKAEELKQRAQATGEQLRGRVHQATAPKKPSEKGQIFAQSTSVKVSPKSRTKVQATRKTYKKSTS